MDEYIKRDDALRALEQINPVDYGAMWDYEAHHYTGECLRDCKDAIDSIPAADVAPVVHAMWIPSESDFDDDDTLFDVEEWCDWQCSACREDICYDDPMPMQLLSKYCPNCGAKMDGGDSDEAD